MLGLPRTLSWRNEICNKITPTPTTPSPLRLLFVSRTGKNTHLKRYESSAASVSAVNRYLGSVYFMVCIGNTKALRKIFHRHSYFIHFSKFISTHIYRLQYLYMYCRIEGKSVDRRISKLDETEGAVGVPIRATLLKHHSADKAHELQFGLVRIMDSESKKMKYTNK